VSLSSSTPVTRCTIMRSGINVVHGWKTRVPVSCSMLRSEISLFFLLILVESAATALFRWARLLRHFYPASWWVWAFRDWPGVQKRKNEISACRDMACCSRSKMLQHCPSDGNVDSGDYWFWVRDGLRSRRISYMLWGYISCNEVALSYINASPCHRSLQSCVNA
jgi:hypothetical protein